MGGDYYDRQVITVGKGLYGNKAMDDQTSMDANFDPKERKVKIQTDALNPIVLGLDITGSMGIWAKVIYDKLPMFFGQILMQKYLKDPAISFCGIGDAINDRAPLQVTFFGKGKQLDCLLSKIWIQKGGGGTDQQSYELAAYFYNRHVSIEKKEVAYFFIIGDEDYYPQMIPQTYETILGGKINERIYGEKEFKILQKSYQVFLLRKQYPKDDEKIHNHWCKTLGAQRVMMVNSPKACIDVILGLIALCSMSRNLQDYIYDMDERGQSEERILEVKAALQNYNKYLVQNGHFKSYVPLNRPPIIKKKIPEEKEEDQKKMEEQKQQDNTLKNINVIVNNPAQQKIDSNLSQQDKIRQKIKLEKLQRTKTEGDIVGQKNQSDNQKPNDLFLFQEEDNQKKEHHEQQLKNQEKKQQKFQPKKEQKDFLEQSKPKVQPNTEEKPKTIPQQKTQNIDRKLKQEVVTSVSQERLNNQNQQVGTKNQQKHSSLINSCPQKVKNSQAINIPKDQKEQTVQIKYKDSAEYQKQKQKEKKDQVYSNVKNNYQKQPIEVSRTFNKSNLSSYQPQQTYQYKQKTDPKKQSFVNLDNKQYYIVTTHLKKPAFPNKKGISLTCTTDSQK